MYARYVLYHELINFNFNSICPISHFESEPGISVLSDLLLITLGFGDAYE